MRRWPGPAGTLTVDDLKLFECPVTREMMDEPVIFSSGLTVMDRASAQQFMNIAAAAGKLPLCTVMQTPMLPICQTYRILQQAIDRHKARLAAESTSEEEEVDLTDA